MKILQLSILFIISGYSLMYAQVGINTPAPLSTLDINAKHATGTSTDIDGILVPRIDRQRAQSMSSVPVSTMIYINSIATGTQNGTAVNIDTTGFYYFNGTSWIKLIPSNTLYTSDGTLNGLRLITTNGNPISFVNGTSTIGIITSETEGGFSASGSAKGSVTLSSSAETLETYADNGNATQMNSSGTITKLTIGTTNTAPLSLKTNGTEKLTLLNNGNVGIGTTSPNTALELNSGTANTSGLRFTDLTSSSPIGTGQALGVDANGNVVTVANPNPTTVSTSSVNSTAEASFNVNDLTAAVISGTSQSISIPMGGKALFIHFMLGVEYLNNPPGSGTAYYEARLYIDGVATDCYMRTQEIGISANASFSISTIKFLAAGNHIIDVRMQRTFNNGTTSGADMICSPLSVSFNASYLN
ncbi:hypothetical protein SAMN05421639_10415 [Chryseobacterium shigense]|uniref:Uncharacterized protein n=1 Tax=Chryseobacterium shigense TaxID=297244 RepID=A0A1N7IJC3_9FLAO|nr:hypothetical protein [Chryseobacterium shigense]SIS37081.1 hypothetical protein SAMN05421639_10415 [Chryseobacterium shigense]